MGLDKNGQNEVQGRPGTFALGKIAREKGRGQFQGLGTIAVLPQAGGNGQPGHGVGGCMQKGVFLPGGSDILVAIPFDGLGDPLGKGLVAYFESLGQEFLGRVIGNEIGNRLQGILELVAPQLPHGQFEACYRCQRTLGIFFNDLGIYLFGSQTIRLVEYGKHGPDGRFVKDPFLGKTHLGDESAFLVRESFRCFFVDFPGSVLFVGHHIDVSDAGQGDIHVFSFRGQVDIGPEFFLGFQEMVVLEIDVPGQHEKIRVLDVIARPAFLHVVHDFESLLVIAELLESSGQPHGTALCHGVVGIVLDHELEIVRCLLVLSGIQIVLSQVIIGQRHVGIIGILGADEFEVALGLGKIAHLEVDEPHAQQGRGESQGFGIVGDRSLEGGHDFLEVGVEVVVKFLEQGIGDQIQGFFPE